MKSLLLVSLLVASASAASAASNEIPFDPNLSGQTVKCSAFRHGADGAWTTLQDVPIQRMNQYTLVARDTAFKAGGAKTVGLDIGAMLDASCPH